MKGNPRGNPNIATIGRKKGTPNNITNLVKHSIIDAFRALGGLDGFVQWGKENRTEFYKIYAKLLPAEMKKDMDDTGGIVVQIIQFKNTELPNDAGIKVINNEENGIIPRQEQ